MLDLNPADHSIKQSRFLSKDSGNQNVEFPGQGSRLVCLFMESSLHLLSLAGGGKHFSRHFKSFGTLGAVVKNVTH